MFDWIKEYMPYISYLGIFYNIMKCAPTFIKRATREWKDFEEDNDLNINEIYEKLEEDGIHVGSNIYTSGYLLQYGQIFVPYTYMDTILHQDNSEIIKTVYEKGKGFQRQSTVTKTLIRKEFVLPVKKLNLFNEVGCAFLYDEQFNKFYLKSDKDSHSKPIMILYDKDRHSKFLNKKVELKGKLQIVPDSIASLLNISSAEDIREICSNFYRPYKESNNLICISLLDEDSKIQCVREPALEENFSELSLPIFVEAKMESMLALDRPDRVIRRFLPNDDPKLKSIKFRDSLYGNLKYGPINFPSLDDINVVYKNGNIGFYMNTSLVNKKKYEEDLERYVRFVNNFSVDYQKFCKKELGKKESMELTFIFDDTKRSLFNSKYMGSEFNNNGYKNISEVSWMIGRGN